MGSTPLRNYTNEVPANISIQRIEDLLVRAGALNINKEYDSAARVLSISFIIAIDDLRLPFRLPAKVDKIYGWLRRRSPKAKEETLRTQASRICWKQLYEWVHLQVSMIEIEQLEKMEAFFPYILDIQKQETVYEKLRNTHFKHLLQ